LLENLDNALSLEAVEQEFLLLELEVLEDVDGKSGACMALMMDLMRYRSRSSTALSSSSSVVFSSSMMVSGVSIASLRVCKKSLPYHLDRKG
jgi:hypothetical protein